MRHNLPVAKNQLYLNRYLRLIESATYSNEYTENHHIVPKSLGGTDDDSNMKRLTARQHFIAHWMLWKAYDTDELSSAFWAMNHQKRTDQARYTKINSKTYEILKVRRRETIKRTNSERWKDPIWAEKTAKSMSEKLKANSELMKKRSILRKAMNNTEKHKRDLKAGWDALKNDAKRYEEYCQIQKNAAAYKIRPVSVDGIVYDNATVVSELFKISKGTVRQRIKSKTHQFKEWCYAD